ncbi:hypothetical protein GCM10022286_23590 [Gryllotalpicola daejeonensis]|uniref:Uncharacterized protein n=1 Tax=Gryllotalpicola daejeonensis TaxID=993087 RepID=A0ABP7ZLP0_9MICO
MPAHAISLEVVAWSSTDPHVGVAATLPGPDGHYRLTVHTMVRTGERLSGNGVAQRVATDPVALASSAAWELLASRLAPIESEEQRPAARAAVEDVDRRVAAAAADAGDLTMWELRPVIVEGDRFALHVRAFPEGFAAFADLGPEVVTISGPHLPPVLELQRRESQGARLLPDPS